MKFPDDFDNCFQKKRETRKACEGMEYGMKCILTMENARYMKRNGRFPEWNANARWVISGFCSKNYAFGRSFLIKFITNYFKVI